MPAAPPPGYGAQYGGPAGPPAAAYGGQFASWATRVGGYLIDAVLVGVPFIILVLLGRVSILFFILAYLFAIAAWFWLAYQVGETGQSPGMRLVGIKCIKESTGQPIGGGMGIVRAIANIVNGLVCYIGWLFPLWDSKRQTLSDKIMSTVVVQVPKQAFSLTPPSS